MSPSKIRDTTTESTLCRHRAGPTVFVHGDIGENALGHRDVLIADAAPDPALDFHRDRRFPDLDHLRVTAHLVADEHRTVKGHGGDRHGGGAAFGAAACNGAAGE